MVAHVDLYRLITGLPGDVVECGVFKGASLIRWATCRSLFETQHSRKIVGFDAFGSFPRSGDDADQAFINSFEIEAGSGISKAELLACLDYKGIGNVDLVAGDVTVTIDDYIKSHPEMRIALLHLDLDVYEPTRASIASLWPRLVPGGVLVIDDFAQVAGATRAVEELMVRDGLRIQKLPFCHVPAYIVK